MKKSIALLSVLLIIMSAMTFSSSRAEDNHISWTEEEIAFMEEHKVIRLGVDPGFVPFEFINEAGAYEGIAADYLSLISEITGLQFEVVRDLTWPEVYDLALAGDIDLLPAIGKTDEREEHFLFSEPYYYFKRVIVTRDTQTDISKMEDMEGQVVAVQRNSSHHGYLLSYPKINLSLYDSVEAALTAVATGSEKAFVGNLATTNYLIRSNGLTNLRFVAFEAEKQQAIYFAVRKDWPQLISIFNKAIGTIPEREKIAINQKWIDLDTDIDYGPIVRLLTIIGTFIVVVLSVSFFWITKLRKEIRQRKRVQEDLEKAKQEAVEANEFKSGFMARMSHEIRTPLNAITGMTYLLKKSNLSLTQKMYADRITQASSNMLNIINDILDFSKIEAGKVELEKASFNIDQVIQDVINIVSYKVEAQEISLKLLKDPLVPNWFLGDSKRLEQVLLNVLNNAVKFTIKGEVSLDIRFIAKENDKYHLSFTVKDTGTGMNQRQVKEIFNPFTQGDSSINRRFGGSGLGLSIVKNLVDLMDGQIQVFSTVGEGSTFVIHLPLYIDIEKEEVYKKTLHVDTLKNIKTLVLEKAETNMNLIDSYLVAFGMHCEVTTSEANARNMLQAADGKLSPPFDLLIVDYETPEEGGFSFVEAVRNSTNIVRKPKFLMLLPMMREDLFDRLSEHGIDIGIGKPITPSLLLNGILDIFQLYAVSTASQPCENEKTCPLSLDKTYNVLLAEDNETNQLIAKSLLQQIGIKAIVASDGKEAVELYHQHKHKIALILMDLHMPVMNGYEAAEEIRKTSNIPIVAMTADVILGVKEKCARSGIYYYISKPFDPDQFLQQVRDIILENENEHLHESMMLDKTQGLKNMGGDMDVYRQVLHEYYNENRDTTDKLLLTIDEKRYDDAAQIVHKVKSSSGSIGAKSLYTLAIKLQKALNEKNEGDIALMQKDFTRKLNKLLIEISEI